MYIVTLDEERRRKWRRSENEKMGKNREKKRKKGKRRIRDIIQLYNVKERVNRLKCLTWAWGYFHLKFF